jgi:hypothetical protein
VIEREWSLEDVSIANDVLDEIERAERRAAWQARQRGRKSED